MFGLLHNLYHYVRLKSERKVTFVLLGLDNAGKTTLSNTLKGELDAEVSPSFGFNKSALQEGKYKVDIYDLGGGKNIRKIWRTYLAEVHGLVYVVDSADPDRFDESRTALMEVAAEAAFLGKPVLVLANKQDLPMSADPATVAAALGLSALQSNSYNIMACSALVPPAAPGGTQVPDGRVRQGLKWLLGQVDYIYPALAARVRVEAEAARQEALLRKRERDEAARLAREERQRLREGPALKEAAAAAGAVVATATAATPMPEAQAGAGTLITGGINALSTLSPLAAAALPHSVDSPKAQAIATTALPSHTTPQLLVFSDLRPTSPGEATMAPATSASRRAVSTSLALPPLPPPGPTGACPTGSSIVSSVANGSSIPSGASVASGPATSWLEGGRVSTSKRPSGDGGIRNAVQLDAPGPATPPMEGPSEGVRPSSSRKHSFSNKVAPAVGAESV